MTRIILLLFASANLFGCAYLGAYIDVKKNETSKSTETVAYAYSIIANYKTGEVIESNVGSIMIKVEDLVVKDITRDLDIINYSFKPQVDFELSGLFLRRKSLAAAKTKTFKFDTETPFKITGSTKYNGMNYYVVANDKSEYKFLVTTDGYFLSDKFISVEGDHYIFTDKDMVMIPREIKFPFFPLSNQSKTDKRQVLSKDFSIPEVNFELIYGGKDATGLHVVYREYTKDGMARQAFFQNLNYERNANTIQFKNTKIEIISSDSQKIVFKVLGDDIKSLEKAGNAALPVTKTTKNEW